MRIIRIGTAGTIVATLVALTAMNVGAASVRVASDGIESRAVCQGVTWPNIPTDCLNRADSRFVRFIRTDVAADHMLSKKSDRLPVAANSGADFVTIEKRGDDYSVLTRFRP